MEIVNLFNPSSHNHLLYPILSRLRLEFELLMANTNLDSPGHMKWADLWATRRLLLWCTLTSFLIAISPLTVPGLLIYVLPINMGYEINMTGNLLAVPTFLAKFGVRTASGVLEISARDQQSPQRRYQRRSPYCWSHSRVRIGHVWPKEDSHPGLRCLRDWYPYPRLLN